MQISFENAHGNRVVNRIFGPRGIIVADPQTKRVAGIYYSRGMDAVQHAPGGTLKRLPDYSQAELPVVMLRLPEKEQLYWGLKVRYPNCRIRINGSEPAGRQLPQETYQRVSAFLNQENNE